MSIILSSFFDAIQEGSWDNTQVQNVKKRNASTIQKVRVLSQLPSFPTLGCPHFLEARRLGRSGHGQEVPVIVKKCGGWNVFRLNGSNHLKWLLEKSPKIMLFNVKTADVQIDSWQHHVEPTESGMSNIQNKPFRSGKKNRPRTPQTQSESKKNGYVIIKPSNGENPWLAPHLAPWLAHNTSVHDETLRPLGLASWGAHGWLGNLFNPGGVLFFGWQEEQKKIETTTPSFK